jgi:hypothetical protein
LIGINGQPNSLVFINNLGAVTQTVSIGGNGIAQSKSTVEVGKTTVIATIPAVSVPGLSSQVKVTNAATPDNGLVFTANGEAGVYVSAISEDKKAADCSDLTVTLIFWTGGSQNHNS